MRCALIGTVCVLAGCTTLGHAPSQQFLERSYWAPYSSNDTSISYEALVAPHIVALDQQPKAFSDLAHDASRRTTSGSRFIITPEFVVRQLRDSSSAVRTPSFMPRLSYEYFRATRLHDTLVGGTALIPPHPEFAWVRLTGFRVSVGHHSNGQAGCFLEGQHPGPTSFEADDCVGLPDTGTIHVNRANGDFSTSYVGLLAHETFINRGGGNRPLYTIGGALGYDWHATAFLPGHSPAIERQFYGSWRAHAQAEAALSDGSNCADDARGWCRWRGRTRITAFYERAPSRHGPLVRRLPEAIVPYRWYAEVSHTFDLIGGTGPFVRSVGGQDYYNIGFVHRRRQTLVGWTFDLGGYESIR